MKPKPFYPQKLICKLNTPVRNFLNQRLLPGIYCNKYYTYDWFEKLLLLTSLKYTRLDLE